MFVSIVISIVITFLIKNNTVLVGILLMFWVGWRAQLEKNSIPKERALKKHRVKYILNIHRKKHAKATKGPAKDRWNSKTHKLECWGSPMRQWCASHTCASRMRTIGSLKFKLSGQQQQKYRFFLWNIVHCSCYCNNISLTFDLSSPIKLLKFSSTPFYLWQSQQG